MEDISRETGYWKWVYHITRVWEYPEGINAKLIGFAVILSTFGNHGKNIRPSAETLSKRANIPVRACGRLRQECMRLGLFRETGKSWAGIPILEISIPKDDEPKPKPRPWDDPWHDPAPYVPPGIPVGELRPPEPEPAKAGRGGRADDDDDDESPAYVSDVGKRVKATAATPAVRRRPWD